MRMIMFLAAMAATCAMAIPLDLKLPTWSELVRAGRPVKTMNVVATVRPVKIDLTDITTMPVGMLLANPLRSDSPTGGVELVSFGIPREWSKGGKCQMAVAYYIHTKGDGFHCELSPPKEK